MGSTDFDPRNRSSVKKADGSCCTPAQQSADVCRGQGLSVDISKADTSKAEDKIRILNCIRLPQARTKARSGAWLACPQMRTYSIDSPCEIHSRACRSTSQVCSFFSFFFPLLFGGLSAYAEFKRKVRWSDLKCEVKR